MKKSKRLGQTCHKRRLQLANKQMEIAQPHCVHQKMQMRTTGHIHFTPNGTAELKRPTTLNADEDLECLRGWWGVQWYHHGGKHLAVSYKGKHRPTL